MTISVIGLNHKSANIDIREKFAFSPDNASLLLRRIKKENNIHEVLVVSTCNRTEIYTDSESGSKDLKGWLMTDKEYRSLAPHLYEYQEEDAIEHLFKVVAGLDSMVVGESEVLGQVKTAYKIALENKTIDNKLKRLFEYSFSVAKNVRTNTDIGGNAISFMYTSILLIKKVFSSVEEKKCLLIGAGEMTELALKYLKSNNVNDITICNRKEEKGKKLASDNNNKKQLSSLRPQTAGSSSGKRATKVSQKQAWSDARKMNTPTEVSPSNYGEVPVKKSSNSNSHQDNNEKTIDSSDEDTEDQQQILKIVKDITSKGFVRNNYKKKLVDLSDIRINLKGKK